jgi:hypothetical protein
MFRYRYVQEVNPPAPFVIVHVGDVDGAHAIRDRLAQVDSAADQTAISQEMADQLQLPKADSQRVTVFGGRMVELPTYWVQLTVRDLPPISVEVLAGPGQDPIILGRDILNRYRIVLDGPAQLLEIGEGTQ